MVYRSIDHTKLPSICSFKTTLQKRNNSGLLLHLAGSEVQIIFETLSDTGEDYPTALAKLTTYMYFKLRKNIPFERHAFQATAVLWAILRTQEQAFIF